jgi:hypothetical protein
MHIKDQKRAIVNRLVGGPPDTLPPLCDFDEPWRSIYRRATRVGCRTEAEILLFNTTAHIQDPEERRACILDLCDLLPGDDVFTFYPSLEEMASQFPSVDWLWPSWIPRGMLTLFGAAPGAGKSLVALDLARRLIHGGAFPDGAPIPCPGASVLIVDAEGAPALLNQRAAAWEIDRRRLFLMLPPDPQSLIDLADPGQQDRLRDMCRLLEPALVVVDSLAAATARGETSIQGARAILGFLASVARDGDLALLVIHHLRKRPRASSPGGAPARSGPAWSAPPGYASAPHVVADDLRGSSHISAAARSVLALSVVAQAPPSPVLSELEAASGAPGPASAAPAAGPRPDLDGLRRFEVVKTNLCRHPPPLGLAFEGHDVPVPTLRYTGYVEPPPPPTQIDLCTRWLYQHLAAAGEPVKPAHVVRAAAGAGFHRRTLYRARQALAGFVVDLGTNAHDPHKRWALAPARPHERPSPHEAPPSREAPPS